MTQTKFLASATFMSSELINVNEFDQHIREHRGWAYDNGRAFKGQSYYDSYGRNERSDGNGEYMSIILLCQGPVPGQGTVIHVNGRTPTEIWVGPVETKAAIEALLLFVEHWEQSDQDST